METNINTALEYIHQVRTVNNLIQGVCARVSSGELSVNEAEGLWVVLEWQNKHLQQAAGAIESLTHEGAAQSRAA